MSFFKPLATLAVIGAMAVVLYVYTHPTSAPAPPPEAAGSWAGPPKIEVPPVGASLPDGMTEFNPSSSVDTTAASGLAASPPAFDSPPLSPEADTPGGSTPWPSATEASTWPPASDESPAASNAPDAANLRRYTSSVDGVPNASEAFAGLPSGDGRGDASVASASSATAWPQDGALASSPTNGSADYRSASSPSGLSGGAEGLSRGANGDASYTAARRQASDLIAAGDLGKALLVLTPWYGEPSLTESDKLELNTLLSELAGTVIYSDSYHLDPPYVVKLGDTLSSIAQSYQIPPALFANINGIPAGQEVQSGQQLKVLRGPFTAVVDLEAKEMALLVEDRYAGRFPIGVGRDLPDMEGNWVVNHKMENPNYYGQQRTIDANDPANPLGEYWIGLQNDHDSYPTIGIHGTNDPARLQSDDPLGYIRLSPTDAKDAYEILSLGSPVVIRR